MLRSSLRVFGDAASSLRTARPHTAAFTTSAHRRALDQVSSSSSSSSSSGEATPGPSTSRSTPPPSSSLASTPAPSSSALTFQPSVLPGSRALPSNSIPHHLRPSRLFRLHVRATRNNTLLTLTDPEGNPVHRTSGGTVGFKKAARSGYEAGYQAALSMFQAIKSRKGNWGRNQGRPFSRLEIIWKGFGEGRDAVYRAMLAAEGEETRGMVRSMSDATKLKIGGVRPKKRRNY